VPMCPQLLTEDERRFLRDCKLGAHDDFLLMYNTDF